MGPPGEAVVIEVRAAGGPLAEATASCSGVLGPGRCRAVDAEGQALGPRFHVVVVFDDDARQTARIELHEARRNAVRAARSVRFGVDDTLSERYRAIGLIAAAQVLSIEPDLARASEPPGRRRAAPTKTEVPEQDAPAAAASRSVSGLDLAALGGAGLDEGGPRLGALARPWWSPFEPVALELSLRFAARPDDPLVTWSSVSIGAAVRLTPRRFPFSVRLRSGARATRVVASTTDAAGENDSSAALQLGPELGAEVSWPQRSSAAAFVGAEIELPRPRLRVEVRGRAAGESPSVVAGGLLGVRFGF